jgi:CHAT domain-containing protein
MRLKKPRFWWAPDGNLDLLTPGDVARLQAVPRLVALSACQSGRGRPLPGTGLLGLARAWLMAGSEGVIASYWPTPDDSGNLFLSFYA